MPPAKRAPTGTAEKTAARRLQALELRKAGATYQQIGERLNISANQAHLDVRRELQKLAEQSAELATEVRQMELERLDAMHLGLWPEARKGHLGAVDRVLRIMERRASLLGLDAPKQQDIRLETLDVVIGAVTNDS